MIANRDLSLPLGLWYSEMVLQNASVGFVISLETKNLINILILSLILSQSQNEDRIYRITPAKKL